MNINVKDIIDLAKAGYKPSDVKELLTLGNTNPTTDDENTSKPAVIEKPAETEKPTGDTVDDPFEKLAKGD